MKHFLIFFIIIFLNFSCTKDNFINGSPDIIFEKDLPSEMNDYSHFSNPILYNNYLIVASSDYLNNKSTFFKLDLNGNYIDKWNVENDHLLGNYIHHNSIYIYDNQLIYNSKYFGVADKKIVAINLENMETNWEVSSSYYRSGMKGLNNKIYLNKYIPNGNAIYEMNLDNQNIELIYQVTNGSFGLFTLPHEPCIYNINDNNTGILITASNNTSYTLINYNITTQQLIWEIAINEFDNAESAPTKVQIKDNKIVVTSNDYIAVRDLNNGDFLWSKNRMSSFVVDKPVLGEAVITDSTDKLFCYNIENGNINWSREDKQDGISAGSSEGRIIYNHFLFDKVPINVQTGEAIWVKLDNWGELNLNFEGKPAINNDELYYIGFRNRKLYKIKMPN